MTFIVAVTGASGVRYAYRLLQQLGDKAHLILSEDAKKVIEAETDLTPEDFATLAVASYSNDDFNSPVASGSYFFDALVIVPCSMSTLAKVALGIADNLITRTASVALKEHRKLIVVPRETPLHTIHLEHLLKLSTLGATVLPAMPAFYHKPKDIDDLVDFVVARILDHLGVHHGLISPWGTETRKAFNETGE